MTVIKEFKTIEIELEFDPIYKIPEGYHVEVDSDGKSLMLFKNEWKPKEGEIYFEPMTVQYKPLKKVCQSYTNLKDKRVFRTMKECKEWCSKKNRVLKRLFKDLTEVS